VKDIHSSRLRDVVCDVRLRPSFEKNIVSLSWLRVSHRLQVMGLVIQFSAAQPSNKWAVYKSHRELLYYRQVNNFL
jgi:hypothetical protein